MKNQSRRDAMAILRGSRTVYADLHCASDTVLARIGKGEVQRLIRSPQWAERGLHLLERPDLGRSTALLSACWNHEECLT